VVGAIDRSAVVDVGEATGACAPCVQQHGEVGSIGHAIEVQVRRADGGVALGGDDVPAEIGVVGGVLRDGRPLAGFSVAAVVVVHRAGKLETVTW